MTEPVNPEIAKLLKENGFDKKVLNCYNIENNNISTAPHHELSNFNAGVHYSAPTIAEVVMWLYKEHGIWISVDLENYTGTWFFTISYNNSETIFGNYSTPTEAYEAAIEYTLNNLIK